MGVSSLRSVPKGGTFQPQEPLLEFCTQVWTLTLLEKGTMQNTYGFYEGFLKVVCITLHKSASLLEKDLFKYDENL